MDELIGQIIEANQAEVLKRIRQTILTANIPGFTEANMDSWKQIPSNYLHQMVNYLTTGDIEGWKKALSNNATQALHMGIEYTNLIQAATKVAPAVQDYVDHKLLEQEQAGSIEAKQARLHLEQRFQRLGALNRSIVTNVGIANQTKED
jgi:hypothetical protein